MSHVPDSALSDTELFRRRLREQYICGPNVSIQLANVLQEVRLTFPSWNQRQKREQCDAVRSYLHLRQTLWAWDICQLHLPYTSWLYDKSFTGAGCGQPKSGNPGTPAIEHAQTSPCGNSVEVGKHCYLAGTVNYSLFGEICRLCNDEFGVLSIDDMRRLIWLWKIADSDDPGPPTDWAIWGFNRRSVTNPPTGLAENRRRCTRRCSIIPTIRFTWRWLPHHPGTCLR
jgi:hypothetical protein